MTGPVDDSRDQPLDPQAYRHQLLLLKSLHCARPVLHDGLSKFIQCLTINQSGCDIGMLVYLTGHPTAIECSQIQIMAMSQPTTEESDQQC
jgi:hypothetical protein